VASNDSDRPLIGLTTYLEQAQTGVWDVQAAFLPKVYFEAVTRAGGIAILLPPQPVDAAAANQVLAALDGLIITGGKDIDPGRYGQDPHPETDEPRKDRDAWEVALLDAAIERGLPFLGICRGAQMLNVALGGTLHQHLPDVLGSNRYGLGGGNFGENEVKVEGGRLAETLAGTESLHVKSYHHQGINAVADGLRVTARSDDGTIQAVELESVPFGIAVQWHPEQDDDIRLFTGLVDAARTYKARATSTGALEGNRQ
jgi:putative glutamine amidotransferase